MSKQGEAIKGFFPATVMPDTDWWQTLWPQPGKVLADLGIEPGTEVVDLCCGDGLFTSPLARMVRHVVAIDLDPEMLDAARAKVAVAGVANCEFVAGDAYAVADLVPQLVDFVLMANTFHGVPDKPRLARRCHHPETGWALCCCQLAPAPARRNNRAWSTARAKDRDADDASRSGDNGRARRAQARRRHRVASLPLRGNFCEASKSS
jgi:SAM-dependent methyltransferase